MDLVLIVPVNGAKVRDPLRLDYLPEEGRMVRLDTYWRRKIAQGYVAVIEKNDEIEEYSYDDQL